ncbi:MAG TPA: hypothetical protein VFQ05_04385, partial [Candidatus Eisenbacteria bacterium]|nr:hypothetical protein [Candidatus Eisenbacteria bacterium]
MNRNHLRQLAVAVAVCASFVAGLARAQTNLAWDDCVSSGGQYSKTVACANTGVFSLLCSFSSPVDITNLAAVDAYMDVKVSGTISPWWSQPGRWSLDTSNATGATCDVASWSQIPMAFTPLVQAMPPSRIRIRSTWVFPVGQEQPVVADQEYYSHTLQLHFRSGTAQDLGCVTPACFHITNVVLMSYGEPDLHL